jgi:uncharacterized protein (TIGR00266 family)
MQHTIKHGPSYAVVDVKLSPGDMLIAESDAMVMSEGDILLEPKLNGARGKGFFGKLFAVFVAMFRKVFGGETMFVNEISAPTQEGRVVLAPTTSGEVLHRALKNERLLLQPGAFMACTTGVEMKTRWAGLRGIFGGEGAVFLECSGTGDLFFNAYGGLEEVEVNGSFIVDTGHMVAFDAGLTFKVRRPGGGLMGLFASGEGLVCEFQGQGKVWIQSRNMSSLVGWLTRLLPS